MKLKQKLNQNLISILNLETADQPETPEQKASKKYINQLLISKLKMTENVPASVQEALEGVVASATNDDDEIYEGDEEA